MKIPFLFCLFVTVPFSFRSMAQCNSIDITAPSSVCINENFTITDNTLATSYQWDFCPGDLAKTPYASLLGKVGFSNAYDITVVNDQNNWYAFAVGYSSNSIRRIDLGSNIGSPTEAVDNNLGNPGGLLSNPGSIEVIKQGNVWFGLVFNQNGNLIVLNFGSSLSNTSPSASSIVTGIGGVEGALDIVQTGSSSFVVLLTNSSGYVCSISFPNGFDNAPGSTNITSIGGYFVDIQIISGCSSYTAFVLRYDTRSLVRLDFGSDLMVAPAATPYSSNLFSFGPYRLWMDKEGDKVYGLASNISGGLASINVGADLTNSSPSINNFGNFNSALSSTYSIDAVNNSGNWLAFTINGGNGNLTELTFPNGSCDASYQFSDQQFPAPLSFSAAGTKDIVVTLSQNDGSKMTKTVQINVSSESAPVFQIDPGNNECVTSPNSFSVNFPNALSGISWDFGDGSGSTLAQPSHQYSTSGTYTVSLTATDQSTGCSNTVASSVTLSDPPVADFLIPSNNPLCTNQSLTFTNTTSYNASADISWQWLLNGTAISSSKDLSYKFTSSSLQDIELIAVIPGCSNQITKSISSLLPGPDVSFVAPSSSCQNDQMAFTNTTNDAISSLSWDFGDGQISSEVSPSHVFTLPGAYQILLAATSNSGCNNSATKNITVYSKPQPDFSLALPPFSCSGSDSQFNDGTANPTDSNLQDWQWDFGDASSGQNTSTDQNPTHLYANAGNYNVSLTVTTDFNCSATAQKTVTISQSPDATITNTPTCKDQTVQFNATKTDIQSWYWQIGNTFYFIDNPTYVFTSVGNHDVFLTITGANGCVSSADKTITVPAQLSPDFSTEKNCVGENTKFIDTTPATADPVADEVWDFSDGSTGQGSPGYHAFNGSGDYNITMVVQSQAGCYYSIVKKVTVVNSPVASFTASPETGVPPLAVQFTNKSTNATSYQWAFNDADNSTTTSASPTFTFNDYGDFVVDLTATNDEGCSSTFSKIIRAALPVNDVALTALNVTDAGDGTWKCIATFKNDGNLNINDVQLVVNISGGPAVQENITSTILPGATLNHALGFEILKASDLNYICAEAVIPNDNNNSNNKLCSQIGETLFIFQTYPNPASDKLHIEWISPDEQSTIAVILFDAIGKEVISTNLESSKGLNEFVLDTSGLRIGLYILGIESKGVKKNQRIVVTH